MFKVFELWLNSEHLPSWLLSFIARSLSTGTRGRWHLHLHPGNEIYQSTIFLSPHYMEIVSISISLRPWRLLHHIIPCWGSARRHRCSSALYQHSFAVSRSERSVLLTEPWKTDTERWIFPRPLSLEVTATAAPFKDMDTTMSMKVPLNSEELLL